MITPLVFMVFLSGQPHIPFADYGMCNDNLRIVNADKTIATCVILESEAISTLAAGLAEHERLQGIIKKLNADWARTDRAWCDGLKLGWYKAGDAMYWPYNERPGDCPKWYLEGGKLKWTHYNEN